MTLYVNMHYSLNFGGIIMALFGKKMEKPATPERALGYMIFNIKNEGDLEKTLDAFQISQAHKDRVLKQNPLIRGYASKYMKKLFKNSEFKITGVTKEDENHATVTVKGKTFDGRVACETALETIEEKGEKAGLFSGKKNIRMIGLALGLLDDVIDELEMGPVEGTVRLENRDTGWELVDRDEFTEVLVREKASVLAEEFKTRFNELKERA